MSSDWILDLIERQRYLAVMLLMLAENIFPPIPSEVVMPVAGIVAGRGDMASWAVILCGTAGAVAGQALWFWLGLKVGKDRLKALAKRHGRWLTVSPRDVDKADRWFDKHGAKAVVIGRVVPGIRTLISLPAGLACMAWPKFLLYSTIGSGVWTAVLAYTGFALGERQENITRYIGPLSTAVFAVIVVYYLYRVITFKKN
jgi:membrane protein DedA with SNARE-associated domain